MVVCDTQGMATKIRINKKERKPLTNMKITNHSDKILKKENRWVAYTIIFAVVITFLLTMLNIRSPLAIFISSIFILTIYIGSFIRAYCKNDTSEEAKNQSSFMMSGQNKKQEKYKKSLSAKELNNSQRLLRYATAVLSFLSLTTTAKGMEDFVFGSSWMSYLGSFGVQGILVVFSLLLCRFYVQIQLIDWPVFVKKLTTHFLIIFFCIALLVSSTFSFSFIANNAYAGSWSSDRESVIQSHLLSYVYSLRSENERRGNLILTKLNEDTVKNLSHVIVSINDKKRNDLQEELIQKINLLNLKKQKKNQVSINKQNWLDRSPEEIHNQIEMLYDTYESTYENGFETVVDEYNDIITNLSAWQNTPPDDSSIITETQHHIRRINRAIRRLKSLLASLPGWMTSQIQKDNNMLRATFETQANTLIDEYKILKRDLKDLQKIAQERMAIEQGDNLSTELNTLLSQIYLLGVDPNIQAQDLIEDLNDLAIRASDSQLYSNDDIQDIIIIRNQLTLYTEYMLLKNDLDNYIKNRIKRTYRIQLSAKDSSTSQNDTQNDVQNNGHATNQNNHQDDEQSNITSVYTVSENEWIKNRNEDFDSLFTYLKSLPDISEITNETTLYNENHILAEAVVLQRDLLGNLKDLEKAFNYFKYPFPVMAYFALFIAVFFDLGSFFTGCFLYATEYFEVHNDKISSKQSK